MNRHLPICVISALILLSTTSRAVPLNNWRLPYYKIAAEMGLFSSSPSGMFWDDLGAVPVLDPSLWPNDSLLRENHWTLEPEFTVVQQAPRDQDLHYFAGRFSVLNDIRYRKILIRQTLMADSRYDEDPFFPAHPDRFARGRIEEAYAQVDWKYGFLRFGRMLRNWGPFIDRSLLVSANPYSYDALEWQVHSSLFEFRQMFAAFAQNDHGQFADNQSGRFFAAHALNIMIKQWVTFGVLETMVFRRENGFPDFQYINPFSIYSVLNTNQEGKGNLMLGFQTIIHPGTEKVALRGQLMLDDFQVDDTMATDKEPAHWAMDAGVYWRDALPLPIRSLVKAGYRRCSEWAYTVSDDGMNWGEGYTYLSKGLGLPENDGDELWAGIGVLGKNYWVGEAGFSYRRDGDKNVLSRWQDSDTASGNISGLPFDYQSKAFPSGVVESALAFSLAGAAYFKDYADARFSFENRWVTNKGNVRTGKTEYSPRISVSLGVHFSDFLIRLPK